MTESLSNIPHISYFQFIDTVDISGFNIRPSQTTILIKHKSYADDFCLNYGANLNQKQFIILARLDG